MNYDLVVSDTGKTGILLPDGFSNCDTLTTTDTANSLYWYADSIKTDIQDRIKNLKKPNPYIYLLISRITGNIMQIIPADCNSSQIQLFFI